MKMTWKTIVPECCKSSVTDHDESSSSLPAETEKQQILKESSSSSCCFQRLCLAELPASPLLLSAEDLSNSLIGSALHVFTFAELREITHNFSPVNLLGEGGFGSVHKGFIHDNLRPGGSLKPQPVAVKLLDLDGTQGHKEWLAEIIFLGQLRHPHLVKLIGYCWEGDHRLLVYEYMARGSLENQLFGRYSAALPWSTRMKIAVGAAEGLAFLHEADKPIIYRDFKASNILLDSDYTAKLSDFGLAKSGLEGDDTHISTRIMGTHGYAAPEYIKTGHLTTMSDVYSFGVVLLEVLTGKRSMDRCGGKREQNLVEWARPLLRSDPRKWNGKFERILIDPRLEGQFSRKGAQKAAELAYKCLSHHPKHRPTMTQVVNILEPLQHYFDDALPVVPFEYIVPKEDDDHHHHHESGNSCLNPRRRGGGGWRHTIRFPILQQASYSDGSLHK